MKGKFIDLTGRRFGKLKVLRRGPNKGEQPCWWCLCFCCGLKVSVRGDILRSGSTKSYSCGCGQQSSNLKHGHAGRRTRTYRTWESMISRCNNKKVINYERYGGRGIRVCKRWRKFENFLKDMGERPPGKTIDRKNPNDNYTPSNCRWATLKQQRANQRCA